MTESTSSVPGPALAMTLVGNGESLLRMQKRLSCAAASLHLSLDLDIRRDPEAMGIPYASTPVVLLDGQPVFTGLPRTEEIEDWLKKNMAVSIGDPS